MTNAFYVSSLRNLFSLTKSQYLPRKVLFIALYHILASHSLYFFGYNSHLHPFHVRFRNPSIYNYYSKQCNGILNSKQGINETYKHSFSQFKSRDRCIWFPYRKFLISFPYCLLSSNFNRDDISNILHTVFSKHLDACPCWHIKHCRLSFFFILDTNWSVCELRDPIKAKTKMPA